jgi:hypothetical protein
MYEIRQDGMVGTDEAALAPAWVAVHIDSSITQLMTWLLPDARQAGSLTNCGAENASRL